MHPISHLVSRDPRLDFRVADFGRPQRFFAGWAQVWRAKVRDDEAIRRTRIDPHAPPQFRCNGAAVHNDGFYEAFSVQPGNAMYLAPEERITLW